MGSTRFDMLPHSSISKLNPMQAEACRRVDSRVRPGHDDGTWHPRRKLRICREPHFTTSSSGLTRGSTPLFGNTVVKAWVAGASPAVTEGNGTSDGAGSLGGSPDKDE